MNYCEKCKEAALGTGVRWVLLDEIQKCIWESPTCIPEVDIESATFLHYYCCEQHAMKGVDEYLSQVGAKAQWSDVRPIETCACCDEDFDTTTWHRVLTLSIEKGLDTDPVIIDATYVARFCTKCVPRIR
jgi:hypothetical protein